MTRLKTQISSFLLLCAISVLAASIAMAASTDTIQSSKGPIEIVAIQHASMAIKAGGKVLYIDPAQGSYEGMPQADYILITDIHGDHLMPAVIQKLKKSGTEIIAPKAVVEQLPEAKALSNGEKSSLGPFQIEAVAMYNMVRGPSEGKFFHDKGRGNGYVITYGGKRLYISGDTEAIPEMKALKNIDVAFLCMNKPTMTPEEAAEGAKAFKPKVVYPYHYKGSDTEAFAKALEGSGIKVRQLDWYAQ
jgi:L-ascorbate metabolism protein UlaG (beta-lactamase superfamily)